jgi:hypothetical protein
MKRVVPAPRRPRLQAALGVLGAVIVSLGVAGCPGDIDPSLIGMTGGGGGGGCDPTNIFAAHSCASATCHDAMGSGAGFSMVNAGWQNTLVGGNPSTTNATTMCVGMGPYLQPGPPPAMGLFLQKIQKSPPCGMQMPYGGITGYLSASEVSCVQKWANGLVSAGGGGGTDAGGGGQ